jgi:two-component system alkaline phosphatase synthesis response regulator PhoP
MKEVVHFLKEGTSMGKNILVVDDEYFITRSLSFLFQKEGFDVRVAHDGEAALEEIKSGQPDLIFMDMDMPKKNGLETVREIRSNPEWQKIHIIMLTAKGQETDEKAGFEAGVNEYTLKPFDPRAILNRVRELLG